MFLSNDPNRKKIIVFLAASDVLVFLRPLMESLHDSGLIVYVASSSCDFYGMCQRVDAFVVFGNGRQFTDSMNSFLQYQPKIMYIWTWVEPLFDRLKTVQYSNNIDKLKFEIFHFLGIH